MPPKITALSGRGAAETAVEQARDLGLLNVDRIDNYVCVCDNTDPHAFGVRVFSALRHLKQPRMKLLPRC